MKQQRAIVAQPRETSGPFLKWAGGKGRLLSQLAPLVPVQFGRYFEPFVGSGALFFHLEPEKAVLSDYNEELINVYRQVQGNVDGLVAALKTYPYEREFYYQMRAQAPGALDDVARAARMIYLNRTCFNGLYRVNRRGEFNVPMGRYENPVICQEARLWAAHAALQGVKLEARGFEACVREARKGDFIYFDPPYFPLNATSSFTSYTESAFGGREQEQLADVFRRLDKKGCRVMLSNSDTPFIRELYGDYRIETVYAARAINRVASRRKKISEVVVLNY